MTQNHCILCPERKEDRKGLYMNNLDDLIINFTLSWIGGDVRLQSLFVNCIYKLNMQQNLYSKAPKRTGLYT